MELTEDRIIEKYGKQCGHCSRKILLPYEYEFTCIGCGFNLIKRKHELSKSQQQKINFIKRLKNAELKIFRLCVEVYQIYQGNNFDKIYDVLSTLRNKKLKNNIFTEKYRDKILNPDFEQNHYFRTAAGVNKIGHGSV